MSSPYARKMLEPVQAYVPGEQPRADKLIKLNTNENPYPPDGSVFGAVRSLPPAAYIKYPDPGALELRSVCAERYGFEGPEWCVAGNGADELLALCLRTFVDPEDAVLTVYPSYSLYDTLVQLHGARFIQVELNGDYSLPGRFFDEQAKLCFLARPNAPTGLAYPLEAMRRFCEGFQGIVVIDEAYVDFAEESCIAFPKEFDNVIITRTFSKGFSMAGLRLGMAYACPDIIAEFLKTKDSYNLNAATQAAGIAAMNAYGTMRGNAEKVIATRERFAQQLRDLGFTAPPSQANFVLAKWEAEPGAPAIFQHLREHNILVRYFDKTGLRDCLRISIGANEQMERVIEVLTEYLS